MNNGEQILDPLWGDGLQGVGLEVRQGVCRGSRYWGQGTAIDSSADSLRKIGGKEALIVWDFLEVLPLSELSNRIEAALTVKLVMDRFIHGYTGSRWYITTHWFL